MLTFSSILYPTDLSDAARPALRVAATIGRWYDARVRILHVAETFAAVGVPPSEVAGLPMSLPIQTPAQTIDAVRQYVDPVLAGDSRDLAVETGDPARVIVQHAIAQASDLIVMGTHGRSGFDRLLHGSVAEKVLMHAPCPVLVVPPQADDAKAGPLFRRILCPMDYSDAALRAFEYALDLGRQAHGTVTVMHVVEFFPDDSLRVPDSFDVAGYRQTLEHEANARLARLVSSVSTTWLDVQPVVAVGRPYRRVLEQAAADGTDLIVMGAQGRDGLELSVFGSATRQVLRGARCPVLVTQATAPSN